MRKDRGRVSEHIAAEIGSDDDFGAERARSGNRHRVDERAVDQPAVTDKEWRENTRQRKRGADGVDDAAARQPDFVAGAYLSCNRGEFHRKVFDENVAECSLELRRKFVAADQA